MTRAGKRRGNLPAAAILLGILAVTVSCGTRAGGPSATPSLPPSPIEGVVVRIDVESLTQIREVDIRTTDGRTVTLAVGTLENAIEFSPSHLAEHMATGVAIRAYYRLYDGRPVIYRLEDAAEGAAPSAA